MASVLFLLLLLLLFFTTRFPAIKGVRTEGWLSAERGESVTITCHYDQKNKHHVKYWCKGYTWSSCTTMVRSDSPQSKGEVSITDNPKKLVFTVTMRNLQEIDTDWYWCGVETEGAMNKSRLWYLLVTAGMQGVRAESWFSAVTGGSVTVQCHYDKKFRHHVKYWYKGETGSSGLIMVRTDSPQSKGEVSITDDPDKLVFKVTMRNLQEEDSGLYCCGVETDGTMVNSAPVYLTVTRATHQGDVVCTATNHAATTPGTTPSATTVALMSTEGNYSINTSFWRWNTDVLLHAAVALVYLICTIMAVLKTWTFCSNS